MAGGPLKIGTIEQVIDLTQGKASVAGLGFITYTNITTTPLKVGQSVVGVYDGATLNECLPLDAPWIDSLVTLNALNTLSLASLRTSLETATCCAVQKGVKTIGQNDASCCTVSEDQIEKMLNLVDSISCIVPEGEIIGGKQAVFEFIVISAPGAKNVVITIGSATYTFTTSAANSDDFATDIAAAINSYYPQNYSYQAQAFPGGASAQVLLWGTDFDEDNGTAIAGTTSLGSFTFSITPKALAEGTAAVLQGQNAITNNDVSIILSKLCTLCKN